MKTQRKTNRSAMGGFISTQFALVLAAITGGAVLVAYEWHAAHPAKTHHSPSTHHQHAAKTAAKN